MYPGMMPPAGPATQEPLATAGEQAQWYGAEWQPSGWRLIIHRLWEVGRGNLVNLEAAQGVGPRPVFLPGWASTLTRIEAPHYDQRNEGGAGRFASNMAGLASDLPYRNLRSPTPYDGY